MKKILLASTALVAFAGAASAEIKMTGSAEMGISGGETILGVDVETLFHQSVDIRFTMTGETDTGLSFGATIDLEDALDRAAAGADTTDDRGQGPDYFVFIKGSFGTLTLGDTDGALDWALTDAGNVANPGSIWDNETIHGGYLGAYGDAAYNNQVLRYDYSFGDFAVAVSAELDGAGVLDTNWALGVKYALDLGGTTVNLGLGYQQLESSGAWVFGNLGPITGPIPGGNDVTIWGASVDAKFAGGFSAGVEFTSFDLDTAGDVDHLGVGVGWASGPIALHANYGVYDFTGGDVSGFGITAAYDLGGGLKVLAGYGSTDVSGAAIPTGANWSLGLKMAF